MFASYPLVLVCGLLSGAGAPDAVAPSDLDKQVKALVAELGDEQFERRQAAQEALLRLGDAIVPVLDRLKRPDDAEARQRLAAIRYELAGYRDDIRAALTAMPEMDRWERQLIPDGLRTLIAGRQPKSADYLLSLIADRKAPLHRRAVSAFVETWDGMSATQIDAYLGAVLVPQAHPRQRYPQGVDAGVGMGYAPVHGYACLPRGEAFRMKTRTSHFLDGKPYGKPYSFTWPMATTGWIRTTDLALGKHTVALETEYTFTHRGTTKTGRVRSCDFTFTMIAADAPDDLVALDDAATDRLVRGALKFAEKESSVNPPQPGNGFPVPLDERRPQVTWEMAPGRRAGLGAIFWKVSRPLPVDLCFEVTLVEPKTGKVWPCDPLILKKGEAIWGYFSPRDAIALARGRVGEVPVKVVLKPSRKMALSTLEVTRYFPGSITSEVLTVKIFDGTEPARIVP